MRVSNQAQASNIYKAAIKTTSKKTAEKTNPDQKEAAKNPKSSDAVRITISEEGKKLASKKYSNLRIMRVNEKVYH